MSFVAQILERAADCHEALVSEVHLGHLVHYTGAQICTWVSAARSRIAVEQISRGDRIAIFAPNCAQWIAADLAIMASGAVSVPLYHRLPANDLAALLRCSSPRLVFVADESYRATIQTAWPEHCPIVTLDELIRQPVSSVAASELGVNDVVSIVFTSGTSGQAKGVMTTCRNIDFVLERAAPQLDRALCGKRGSDVLFHYLPFCFSASRTMLWVQLSRGRPVVLSTELSHLPEELSVSGATHLLSVPMVLERIRRRVEARIAQKGGAVAWLYQRALQLQDKAKSEPLSIPERAIIGLTKYSLFAGIRRKLASNLRLIISGSAPLSTETQMWFDWLSIPVLQAYGLTETSGVATMEDPRHHRPGYVGRPLEGMDCRIGEDGELWLRGENIFAGYWMDSGASAQALSSGWFRTGDLVEEDNGDLRIVGRSKNLLVLDSGHNVAPEPLEEELQTQCPAIEQCVILGHARPHLVALYYGPTDSGQVEAAISSINGRSPHYRRIRAQYKMPDALTIGNGMLTANQKVRRSAVESHFADAIEQLYAVES